MKKEETYNRLCEAAKSITGFDIRLVHGIRKAKYVRVRAVIIVLMCNLHATRTTELKELMGLDHTTVIYHRDAHEDRLFGDDEYAELFEKMEEAFSKVADVTSNADMVKIIGLIRTTLPV